MNQSCAKRGVGEEKTRAAAPWFTRPDETKVAMSTPSTCVILNPRAGRRRLVDRSEELARLVGCKYDLQTTTGPGHAEDLALAAAKDGYATVAAAGGDGTVHEVANGLLRSGRSDVVLQVLPVGSANDYAHSIGRLAKTEGQPPVRAVDVGVVRGDGRERYFVNGLGVGFNGGVVLESRRIGWLRGVPLYTLALLRALVRHFRQVPLTCTFDEASLRQAVVALTVNLGRREGNFVMTPAARLDDGLFDYLLAGNLKRWEILRFVPGMIIGRLPTWHPEIRTGQCRRITVGAEEPLIVHVDGEFFCKPEDGVRGLEVELLPGRLQVRLPGG
jgi:diacylglycerol kinase family enzyme